MVVSVLEYFNKSFFYNMKFHIHHKNLCKNALFATSKSNDYTWKISVGII